MLLDSPPPPPPPIAPPRRRALDNPRVLTLAVTLLLGVLAAALWLPSVAGLDQALIGSEAVFYALAAVSLTLLLVLVAVLGRNIVKLWVEGRRGAPFARFRAKLVAALLAMTIVPATLVLVIGSEYLRSFADRYFSVPVEESLSAAQKIARQYHLFR